MSLIVLRRAVRSQKTRPSILSSIRFGATPPTIQSARYWMAHSLTDVMRWPTWQSSIAPEIFILQNNPGSTPMNPVFAATKGENYRIVKVFDKTYLAGMDYSLCSSRPRRHHRQNPQYRSATRSDAPSCMMCNSAIILVS